MSSAQSGTRPLPGNERPAGELVSELWENTVVLVRNELELSISVVEQKAEQIVQKAEQKAETLKNEVMQEAEQKLYRLKDEALSEVEDKVDQLKREAGTAVVGGGIAHAGGLALVAAAVLLL